MRLIDLKKKLSKYQIIIFDLDDTIFSQQNYDTPALILVSKLIEKKIGISAKVIFQKLRKQKKIRRGKAPQLLFNNFFKNIKIDKKNLTISKCVSMFQNFECKNLANSKSLKLFIKNLYKDRTLFLVTNGNVARQNKKIKYLGIKKFFKRIYILDGVRKKIKPSIANTDTLVKFLKTHEDLKAVYVGDNMVSDKKFAKNLKIDFIFYEFPSI